MQIHQLLQECKRHSRSAQKTLYHSFATRMFLLCRRYMKTDEEAEEVMMNGFLKFFQTLNFLQVLLINFYFYLNLFFK